MNHTPKTLPPCDHDECGPTGCHHDDASSQVPCSAFVLSLFPKPCHPRKRHRCRLCGEWIEVKEECCRWSGFDGGDGPWTSHAHPECYDSMEGEDDGTWESLMPGDCERPAVRMYWPNGKDHGHE